MDAGPIEELRAKYGDTREAEGFIYSEELIPSVVFKPKKGTEGLTLQRVDIAPGSSTCVEWRG